MGRFSNIMSVHLHKVEPVSAKLVGASFRPHRTTRPPNAQDLSEIESKINSVLSTLDSLEDDIVEYRRDKIRKQLVGPSVFDYIRAGFMMFIVVGIPFILIEVFSRDWNKVESSG